MTPTSGSRPTARRSGHWIAWLPPFIALTKGHSSITFACCISLWSNDFQLQLIPAHFRQHVCVRVPCSMWSVESCQRVCGLISVLIEMYMYVHVYVYRCLNICVLVSVHAYACVSGYLFACAYRRVTVTQSSAARPPARSASRSSVFSGRHVLGWAVPAARNPWPARHVNLAFRTRAPRSPCCGWCMCCFCGVLPCSCACC